MAKDKKLKVPKRIAGVKVPKKIRKPVNQALALAENPAARELAVAALTAAAAALTQKKVDERPDGAPSAADGADAVKAQATKLGDVIIAAALGGARRLLDGIENPPAAPATDAAKPKRRRRASAAPEPEPAPDA